MIQIILYTSYDTLQKVDVPSDDDSFLNDNDLTSETFDIQLNNSLNLDDDHHPVSTKSDSGNNYHEPRSSKFKSLNETLKCLMFTILEII